MTREEFKELTGKEVVILDGATGSNLMKAGMPLSLIHISEPTRPY